MCVSSSSCFVQLGPCSEAICLVILDTEEEGCVCVRVRKRDRKKGECVRVREREMARKVSVCVEIRKKDMIERCV
jgi:hypothetical protein